MNSDADLKRLGYARVRAPRKETPAGLELTALATSSIYMEEVVCSIFTKLQDKILK